MAAGESRIVAVCDVDPNQAALACERVRKASADNSKQYIDYSELLLKEKPEIAIVTTPDYWHPLI